MRLLGETFPNELVIISVHSAKFPSEGLTPNIREAIMRHGLDHPVVNDSNLQIWQSYAVKAWPTLVIIDPQGKLVHTQSGEILARDFIPPIETLINEAEAKGLLDRQALELRAERLTEPLRPLAYPAKLLLTDTGLLYLADTGHHRLLEVQLDAAGFSGEIVRVFGSGRPGLEDGPAATARFHSPHGLALSGQTLYVADTGNHAVRAVDLAQGTVRLVAGTGHKAHGQVRLGEPRETPLRSPWALLAIDDIVFIAMAGLHQVWALLQEEQIGPFFGNGREALIDGDQMQSSFNQPSDLAMGMGHMFVADAEASAIRAIALLEEKPRVVTLVGQGLFEFGDVDGMGSMVRLQHPTGLTFYEGLVYIADSYNHKIKTLDPTTGQVKTLIGSGQPGHRDGDFENAELFEPGGVSANQDRLYLADTNNHLVRVADLSSQVLHTLALRGLERLQTVPLEEMDPPSERFDPLLVGAGEVTFYFDIELPAGYKFNPETPITLDVSQPGAANRYTFAPGETPSITLPIHADQDVKVNLILYYCETTAERLCLIHQAGFVLPCLSGEVGPSLVRVPFRVAKSRTRN